MLLKRYSRSHLKSLIDSYLSSEEFEKMPESMPAKKISNRKNKEELLKDIKFYAEYSIKNIANNDEDTDKLLKETIKYCEDIDEKGLIKIRGMLNESTRN